MHAVFRGIYTKLLLPEGGLRLYDVSVLLVGTRGEISGETRPFM